MVTLTRDRAASSLSPPHREATTLVVNLYLSSSFPFVMDVIKFTIRSDGLGGKGGGGGGVALCLKTTL